MFRKIKPLSTTLFFVWSVLIDTVATHVNLHYIIRSMEYIDKQRIYKSFIFHW